MNKSHLLGAVCAATFSFVCYTAPAYAIEIQYIVTGTLAEVDGSTDSLNFEQAQYQSVLMIDTDAIPLFTKEYDDATDPFTFAQWRVPMTTTIWQRPNGFQDRQLDLQASVRLSNYFRWDDSTPQPDDLSIWPGVLQSQDPEFFELNTNGAFGFKLRNDYWSNTLSPPPVFFPDLPTLPTQLLPSDIVGVTNTTYVFWGRSSPLDEESLYALENMQISISSVPLPAALWLFGSGLLGLIGVSTRKKAA